MDESELIDRLQQGNNTYPGSSWVDDSNFWKCQALEKLKSAEEAGGVPILMRVAGKADVPELREQAIFWLCQTEGAPEVVGFLKKVVLKDPDSKIQKKALFALTQMSNENGPYAVGLDDSKVIKQVALLFHVHRQDKNIQIDNVRLSNLSLHVDLKGHPII
ncbi:HEAT repeat domain-containing protein [candidate division KSB1 bacterium]|nr:HEAT repeat domain-containing protein [candidate division KSB1 bacterium]